MELIFEDKSCKATYFENHKRVFFEFNGYINLEQAIKMYTAVLEFMKTHKVVSFLNDLQKRLPRNRLAYKQSAYFQDLAMYFHWH